MPDPFLAGLLLDGRKCVVIGGDAPAADKTARLLDAGAHVTLVSPTLDDDTLRELVARGGLEWHARPLRDADLDGAYLVILSERDPLRAAQLFARARGPHGFLLCCLDQPPYCTFTSVALVRRGPLQIGVATGNAAPSLASRIRAALDAQLGPDVTAFVRRLGALRRATPPGERRTVMDRALAGFVLTVSYVLPASAAGNGGDEPPAGAD